MLKKPRTVENKVHQIMRLHLKSLELILAGYENLEMDDAVSQFFEYLHNPSLPLWEFYEVMETILIGQSGIGEELFHSLYDLLHRYETTIQAHLKSYSLEYRNHGTEFPGQQLFDLIVQYTTPEINKGQLSAADIKTLATAVQPLADLAATYREGIDIHAKQGPRYCVHSLQTSSISLITETYFSFMISCVVSPARAFGSGEAFPGQICSGCPTRSQRTVTFQDLFCSFVQCVKH